MNLLIITLSLSGKNGIGRFSVGVINALSKYNAESGIKFLCDW